MSPRGINHGGGVDSGGAEHRVVERLRACSIEFCENMPAGYGPPLNPDGPEAADHIEAQSRLLTKSLCTLQALVSNMEESGASASASEFLAAAHEQAKKPLVAIDIRTGNVGRMGVMWVETTTALTAVQAAITAVLGTFDLEALKTLVGEIDDVLGGSR